MPGSPNTPKAPQVEEKPPLPAERKLSASRSTGTAEQTTSKSSPRNHTFCYLAVGMVVIACLLVSVLLVVVVDTLISARLITDVQLLREEVESVQRILSEHVMYITQNNSFV